MNSFIKKVGKWFKKSSFGLVITSIALAFVICVGLIVSNNNEDTVVNKPSETISAVESNRPSESTTVEQVIEKIRMPFSIDATIARYFFDSSDSIEIKSQALVSYENKFVPSLGVDYTYDNQKFEVVAAFKGKVVEKVNDSLYGLTVIVENELGLRSHYCGLSEVSVYVDQEVNQGQLIGKSGESVINATLGNHLHFAIEFEDNFINPLKVYDKTVSEVVK